MSMLDLFGSTTVLYSTVSHVTESSRHRVVTRMASTHTKLSSKKCRIFRMGPIHLVWPPCILCVRSVTLHTFCMVPCFLYENPAPCILYVMCLQNRDTTLIYPDSLTWDLSVFIQCNLNNNTVDTVPGTVIRLDRVQMTPSMMDQLPLKLK